MKHWPEGPRYTVGSLTGCTINQGARGGGSKTRPFPCLWYVHDRAYCHQVVMKTWYQEEARALAARLEAEQ